MHSIGSFFSMYFAELKITNLSYKADFWQCGEDKDFQSSRSRFESLPSQNFMFSMKSETCQIFRWHSWYDKKALKRSVRVGILAFTHICSTLIIRVWVLFFSTFIKTTIFRQFFKFPSKRLQKKFYSLMPFPFSRICECQVDLVLQIS